MAVSSKTIGIAVGLILVGLYSTAGNPPKSTAPVVDTSVEASNDVTVDEPGVAGSVDAEAKVDTVLVSRVVDGDTIELADVDRRSRMFQSASALASGRSLHSHTNN